MYENKVRYSNSFEIASNMIEARIAFKLETPVIGKDGEITEVNTEDVVDIRLNPVMLRQLADMAKDVADRQEATIKELNDTQKDMN